MTKRQHILIAIGLIAGACVIFSLSVYDIVTAQGWMLPLLSAYGLLLLPVLLLFAAPRLLEAAPTGPVQDARRHFKCPKCGELFSVTAPQDSERPFSLSCPACGYVGTIRKGAPRTTGPSPAVSAERMFICRSCGTHITVGDTGNETKEQVQVLSCPSCGAQQPLHPGTR